MKKGEDNYTYFFEGALYINLTNRCSNDCEFCIRRSGDGILGTGLWLSHEPTAEEVIVDIDYHKTEFSEAVFCGYGESTYRLDELLSIAKHLKSIGKSVRLNTNGLGNLINKADITPLLKGVIDAVSVSLNHADAKSYNKICRPLFVENAFDAVLEFAQKCNNLGIKTTMTAVDIIGEKNIKKCEDLCKNLGLKFKCRKHITDNVDYK